MGFIGRIVTAGWNAREMSARDFIWLAGLGSAARGPVELDDIFRAIASITAGQWLPVGELVTTATAEMERSGHLRMVSPQNSRLCLTERGMQTLLLLLDQPLPRPGTVLGQVGVRFRLAFLDLMEDEVRRACLLDMTEAYRTEIQSRVIEAPCPACGPLGIAWDAHDLDRLRTELALLEQMAVTSATP
ncbi:MAG TPA: hypothetical protein VL974_08050 [Magnetospirillum sp.]|jgi:hypothetical protein|nr:hypothetical protein [Magnetospirillum sp.]